MQENDLKDKKQSLPNEVASEKKEIVSETKTEVNVHKVGILGEKLGMSQIFDSDGNIIPVTVIRVHTGTIVQLKSKEKEGYDAIRVAFKEIKEAKLNKPRAGIFKKNKMNCFQMLREFRVAIVNDYKLGDKIIIDQFEKGHLVDVVGVSKGKGFQGVVKRHHFKGGPKTRGQSDRWRAPGSIGSGTCPGRVWKGTRMAGRMGNDLKTIQNLTVVEIDKDKNILLIRGAVPGPKNRFVRINHAVKNHK